MVKRGVRGRDQVPDYEKITNRRTFLIGAGVVGVAGCIGGEDDGEDGSEETMEGGAEDAIEGETNGEDGFVDTPFRSGWARQDPRENTLNPYAASTIYELENLLYFHSGIPSLITGERLWLDLESYELDLEANELRATIKDRVHWHQGGEIIDDVTAEDWAMMEEMDRLMRDEIPENSPVVDWYADGPDDKTLIKELNPDGVNDQILINELDRVHITHYRNGWVVEYYEALKDATSEDERNEIRTAVTQENIYVHEDPPLSGPYMFENATPRALSLRRYPEHWSADVVNWDRFELVNLTTEGDADWAAAREDELDTNFGIPQTVDDPPDFVKQIASPAGNDTGEALVINYAGESPDFMRVEGGEPAGERSALIRQAIAHAIDFSLPLLNERGERVADATRLAQRPFPGEHRRDEERFPELWDATPSFVEQDLDAAREKLERAGLEFDGDTWVTPEGNVFSLSIGSFSWAREIMSTIAGHLDDVGLSAEHHVKDDTVMHSELADGSFNVSKAWTNYTDPLSVRSAYWLTAEWPALNQPDEFEIPPVGEYDAAPTETVNPSELSADFETAPEDEHVEETRTLLWTTAYHLPLIPLWPLYSSIQVNTRHFDWPSPMPDGQYAVASEEDHVIWGVPFGWREMRKGIEGTVAKE